MSPTPAAGHTRPVPTDSEGEQAVDGRTARGQRTRAAVVDALLALQEEGDLTPTAQRVAERAGVALRSVFGHFSDLETLWAEAGTRELDKLAALAVPVSAELPLAERIALFSASRARTLEALLPVMRAARLREPTSPQLQANRRLFIAAGDAEVAQAFGPELAERGSQADTLVVAIYLAAGGPAWEGLRHDRGLDVAAATELLRRTVSRLVDPHGGPL